MELIRLDRFIANQTEHSRKDVKTLVKKGCIKVNDEVVKSSDAKIDADIDDVSVNGVSICYKKYIYIMLNKPDGYVCSTRDGVSPTVLDLIPDEIKNVHKGIFPAGRLDKDTEGFVFLTNDGALSHEILSPKKHIPKYYLVKLNKPFKESYVKQFDEGLVLKTGERCLPARVCGFENDINCAFIELYEGKYHQIKRMFASVENNVEYLFRTQLGGLVMHDKLGVGEHLIMLHKDVENLTKNFDFLTAKENSSNFFRHIK